MTENLLPDPVERFLEQSPAAPPSGEARQALLLQTQKVVRGRRLRKRLGLALALLACYLAGAATMQAWVRGFRSRPEITNLQGTSEPEQGLAQQGSLTPMNPTPPVPIEMDPDAPAALVELIAARSPAHQALLYRSAGDRYWRELGDVESALRCYRLALASPESDLSLDPEDNWILMALKQARQKEKNYANHDG